MKQKYIDEIKLTNMKNNIHILNKAVKGFSLLLFIILFANYSIFSQTTEPFTASGDFTVKAGVTSITVECWGAGGGGGTASTNGVNCGGGGGGAYSLLVINGVSENDVFAVVVGSGGGAGTDGGNSTFGGNLVIAAGGKGVATNTTSGGLGGVLADCTGSTVYNGGNGGNGAGTESGGGGGGAGTTGAGGNGGSPTAGTGAALNGGNGGIGVANVDNTSGNPGLTYGGGGSGGAKEKGSTKSGGSGANGYVTVTYTAAAIPTITLGTVSDVCEGITTTNLPYTATTNSPDKYSINYADGSFTDVTLADLTASPIVLTIPGTATAGTYDADLTVTNSGTSETSSIYPITITILTTPTTVTVSGAGTFCDNTILTASGGTGGTIYWQNTTSGGTSTATASSSENVTASGTYYFRAENAGCWSTEGSATVTINTTPAAVTASGAGTFCDNTTVTASGGAGGTIYWQNTTSGGTSTTTASSSEVVAASGTYYFRAENNGCWGTEGSVTVTINATPTAVSVSGGGTVCDNTTLTASGGVGGTMYWQNTTSGGTSTASASSSELISTSGTYYFRAENAGCWSTEGSAAVTVDITPTDDPIVGPASVLANTAGYVYSITEIPGATYTWTKPGPWSITAGQGTYSITVTSGNSGGDIGVTVSNGCGTGNSSKTISIGAPPDCPTSSSVTPDGIQTVCEDIATSQLTNTITSSGGSGTYSPLYQWYYNTSNSNTVAGATKIAGATSQNYTPLSTLTEVGNRWYFCVGYATDNTCAQTDATQGLASDAEQITVDPKPGTPTAITGSANVTPSTPGLIYSTTSTNADANGYTWILPTGWTQTAGGTSNSITVTSGTNGQNGNITVTASNACGTSTLTAIAVVSSSVDAPPTITLGANPTSCENTLADLTYSSTTDSPDKYSINYNSTAEGQGFVDVTDAVLPASPIKISVPNNVRAGTYDGVLTVKNSTSGLSSSNYSISVIVNGKSGNITGILTANANTAGYVYSIATVDNAISYSWTVPTNWSITSGGTTNSITVTSGGNGDNGNITVQVVYACGTGTASTIAVTASLVTDHTGINCSNCHTFHNAAGSALTNAAAASDLCMGCHNAGSIAKDLPFLVTDQANSTGNKNSHSWDATAINATYDAVLPTINNELATRVIDGKISCATCHDQHNGNSETNYLRIANTNDVICKDCHLPRDVGIYTDAPATNKGSHPIDITYDETDTRFNLASASTLVTSNGETIICSTCHGVHDVNNTGALTTDGNLLKMTNDNNLCLDCHTAMTHNTMTCIDCHDVHNSDKTNIYMIRSNISVTTPAPATINAPVVFTAQTGVGSYVDKVGGYDGICEVCHTTTGHDLNDGSAIPHLDATDKRETNCIGCHAHDGGFAASGCTGCHAAAQSGPRGGVGQIVGAGGEFNNTHMHTAAAPTDADCQNCHYSSGSHPTDAMNLRNVDLVDTEYSGDQDVYCVKCHDATPPANMPADTKYDKSNYTVNSNKHDLMATNSCALCHNRHGSANANLLAIAGNYQVCNSCHTAGQSASGLSTDSWTSGTNSHAWNVSATNATYDAVSPSNTTLDARLEGGTTIVCSTCHDSHDNSNNKLLSISNSTDQMCKDCHSARDIARYQDNSANLGSHPVGVTYSGTGSVKATPTGSVITIGGNVECSSCHQPHNATISNDGTLLRQANNVTICNDCHTYGTHNGQDCLDCHEAHNTSNTNIYMIKNPITVPASAGGGDWAVVFPDETEFADGDGTYNGVCEVCHTTNSKDYHYNNSGGDHSHEAGNNCTGCHTHNTNFAAPSCHGCHDASLPHEYPTIIDGYNEGSHAVHASKYVCSTCHLDRGSGGANEGGTHPDDATPDVVFDPSGLAVNGGGNTPVYNGDGTCSNIYCHSNTAGTYTTTPNWNSGSITTCTPCHGVDVASSVAPSTGAHAKHTGTPYSFACATCHNGMTMNDNSHSTHVDGTKDIGGFDLTGLATRNGNDVGTSGYTAPSYASGTKTCSNLYCHSDGRSAYRGQNAAQTISWSKTFGPLNASDNIYATPVWTDNITACTSCHNGTGNMSSPYTITTPGYDPANPPASGKHTSAAHLSNSQEFLPGGADDNGWAVVQCFWCHNTNNGDDGSPINQGTYNTSLHVDGTTHFDPRSAVDGGTMLNGVGGGSFTYSMLGSATHCGDGKKCW